MECPRHVGFLVRSDFPVSLMAKVSTVDSSAALGKSLAQEDELLQPGKVCEQPVLFHLEQGPQSSYLG